MGAVKDALKTSGMSIDEVKKVIMFGGGQRVPSVQEALRKELGDKLELSFSINSDEAAALGGSYQGAYVTKFFRVQTIWVKDHREGGAAVGGEVGLLWKATALSSCKIFDSNLHFLVPGIKLPRVMSVHFGSVQFGPLVATL